MTGPDLIDLLENLLPTFSFCRFCAAAASFFFGPEQQSLPGRRYRTDPIEADPDETQCRTTPF
jgi:hypothetical protein